MNCPVSLRNDKLIPLDLNQNILLKLKNPEEQKNQTFDI